MAGKITKAQAGYSEGQPHCGVCRFFIEAEGEDESADACKLVDGQIDEDMWCRLYRGKSLAEGK